MRAINYRTVSEKEIIDKMERFGIDRSRSRSLIANLADIGILEKISAWKEPKKEAWRIIDCYFSFWHTFMPRVSQAVRNGQSGPAARFILDNYSAYVGGVFEKICVQWLKKESAAGQLPINAVNFGKWWGTDNRLRQQAEIDIVADDFKGNMIFAECKWQNEPMDFDQAEKLISRADLVKQSGNRERMFYFFSKSGFTPQMLEKAGRMEDCRLLALEDMGGRQEETFQPEVVSFRM